MMNLASIEHRGFSATLVHLGLCRVVATGRYLTAAERHTATATHGGRQVRPHPALRHQGPEMISPDTTPLNFPKVV